MNADDREMVFRWRNDPFIVVHGSSNREVNRIEHAKWFEDTLAERGRKMYVVVKQNVPIGQVRFDRETQRDCVLSVYLLREFTGHGWGVQAIRDGCRLIFDTWDVERVIACVRNDNRGGRSAFRKAGFEEGEVGCPANHYSLFFRRSKTTSLDE